MSLPAIRPRNLQPKEKVAAILMAMGQGSAGRVMKHMPPDDLRLVTHAMAELKPVPVNQIEDLVDEFVDQFGGGTNLVGDMSNVQKLLSGFLPQDQINDILSEMEGKVNQSIWDRISSISEGSLIPYMLNEHPQTTALVLSKLNPATAAKVMSEFPEDLRNSVARRMLNCKAVVDDALKLVETAVHEDFMVNLSLNLGGDSHARMAEIINKMDNDQMEGVLDGLNSSNPKSAEILRSLLFTFDDVVKLNPKALSTLLDTVETDDLTMALKGTTDQFRSTVLASMAARTKRMVEQELSSGAPATAREVNDARRRITEQALALGRAGEIDMATGDDDGELLQ